MKKSEMIDYITNFEAYPTMNSWNKAYGYSFNVKIHSLPLTSKEKDKMYEIISDEGLSEDFYFSCDEIISDYEHKINKLWNGQRSDPLKHITELYPDTQYKTRCDMCYRKTWYEKEQPCKVENCKGTLKIIPSISEEQKKRILSRVFEIGFNGRSGGHLVLYKWNGYNYTGTGWIHTRDELEETLVSEIKDIYKVLREFKACYQALIDLCKSYASEEIEEYTEEKIITVTGKRFIN